MKERWFWGVISASSLLLGMILYLLFRSDTYIHTLLNWSYILPFPHRGIPLDIIRYHLPDFIWEFSLCSGLYAIALPQKRGKYGWPLCALCLGVAWEMLQWTECISGTGDVLDVLSYGTAALAAVYIKIRKEVIPMKKWGLILLCVLLMGTFVLFALGSGSDESGDQGSGKADGDTSLGDYTVVIDSCRKAKDYLEKDVIIVKYIFTNNSDEAEAFYLAFEDHVYQDGIGLNEAYVLDDSANYSSDNQTKEIKPGASIEVEIAYELNDTTTDIVVELEELFSFSDKVITKTFTIS